MGSAGSSISAAVKVISGGLSSTIIPFAAPVMLLVSETFPAASVHLISVMLPFQSAERVIFATPSSILAAAFCAVPDAGVMV